MDRFARAAPQDPGPAGLTFRYTARLGAASWPASRAGGKANGLHQLMRAGFEVPPAFCILTDAFNQAVARRVHKVEALAELREALLAHELNAELLKEIDAQMRLIELSQPNHAQHLGWAIRSSALDEDTAAHSLAGQQKTVLGACSPEEIAAGVRAVWASLYDTNALLYRQRFQGAPRPASMAVIVQRMLAPSAAGVLFTQNPLTQDADQIVVNASSGLGQGVVGGRAADTYYLDKSSGYVERFEAGELAAEDGRSPGEQAGQGALSADQLEELADCARRLDVAFEQPQDVEWAFAPLSGSESAHGIQPKLFLLQARPITARSLPENGSNSTFSPGSGAQKRRRAAQVWTNVNVGEALPGVATPLTWSVIRSFSRRGFEQAFGSLGLTVPEDYELVGAFRGRVYLNLSQFMSIASAIPLLSPQTLFEIAGGSRVEMLDGLYERRPSAEFLSRLPLTGARVLASQAAIPAVAPLWGRYFARWRDDFFARDLSELNHLEFRQLLDEVDQIFERTGLLMLACSSNFLMSFVVMREFMRLWGGREAVRHEQALVSALGVESAKPGYDLLKLGRLARRSRRLRRVIEAHDPGEVLAALEALRGHEDVDVFLAELARFRRLHGHRAPREAELATPRWREDTGFLFKVVQGYIRAAHLPSERELAREHQQARRRVEALVGRIFPAGVAPFFRGLLGATRANARRRELMRARVVDTLDMYRRYFLECGRRLVLQEAIRRPEDVFYLRSEDLRHWLDDLSSATDFAMRVLQARALHDAFSAMPSSPSTFVLEGERILRPQDFQATRGTHQTPGVPEDAAHRGPRVDELRGLPGSPGRVTARARVMLDPQQDAQLEPGEILVAPWADIGWTPLFLTASALVTGLGGPLSHACIVAREYGLPTVVNAHGATDLIQTGDLITVDADRGVIYIRERA